MWPWIAGGVALSAYSAYMNAQQANKQSKQIEANAKRRNAIQNAVSKDQVAEQSTVAFEQMTEIGREFMKAKGSIVASQAESGVSGKSQRRLNIITSNKEGEAKSKVATEIDTNVVNIARGALARKIDTEAQINEARLMKKNSMQIASDMIVSGASGGLVGYQLGSAINQSSPTQNQSKTIP